MTAFSWASWRKYSVKKLPVSRRWFGHTHTKKPQTNNKQKTCKNKINNNKTTTHKNKLDYKVVDNQVK